MSNTNPEKSSCGILPQNWLGPAAGCRSCFFGALLLCLCLPGLLSCGRETGGAAAKPQLLFFCGAGLRAPVQELIQEFEKAHTVSIAADYSGSERLLSKLKVSETGDLFLPGDRRYVELLAGTGRLVPNIAARQG